MNQSGRRKTKVLKNQKKTKKALKNLLDWRVEMFSDA